MGNQAKRGYAIEHIPVPVPSPDKLGGLWQEGGLLISLDRVAPTRIVGVSAFCCPPWHREVQKKLFSGIGSPDRFVVLFLKLIIRAAMHYAI